VPFVMVAFLLVMERLEAALLGAPPADLDGEPVVPGRGPLGT
jgi:hypothetical protein